MLGSDGPIPQVTRTFLGQSSLFTDVQHDGGRSEVPATVERLLCDVPAVAFAVLFGSRTTGTPRSTSDLDVAVRFSEDLTAEERFRTLCRLSGRVQHDDAPFVDLSDFEELPLEVAHAAVHGQFLCGDEGAFRAARDRIEASYEEQREDIERRHRDTISRIASGGLRG